MNRIIVAIITIMMLCPLAQAKNRTVTENDSLGNKKRVIELRDTVINGESVTDTLSIMTYESSSRDNPDSEDERYRNEYNNGNFDWPPLVNDSKAIVALACVVFFSGIPLLIVFTIFFFNYKKRKAQYRLAEQALASGHPLPEDFFRNIKSEKDIRTKGISNVFCGIGLFIFLWAITNEFGVACIGLLIMFTGFGQLVIYYTTQNSNKQDKEK